MQIDFKSCIEEIAAALQEFCNRWYIREHVESNCHVPLLKIVSEYDQEIPQSHTVDKPVASRGRATQQSRDTRKTN